MDNPLGKQVSYSDVFDPTLLYPIARAQSRVQLGIKDPVPFEGIDRWTCYEVSWLSPEGAPLVGIASIEYPAHSPNIVESKSLKLFLGSMNFTQFPSRESVVSAIKDALSPVLRDSRISVQISLPEEWHSYAVQPVPGECIDAVVGNSTSSGLIQSEDGEVSELLHSNLLRSLCPVTNQPDWGTLVLYYRGKKLNRASLAQYLVRHRSYQGFHEECCERIFSDVARAIKPSELWVGCFYTRRGGIDINPERWLPGTQRPAPVGRLARQ